MYKTWTQAYVDVHTDTICYTCNAREAWMYKTWTQAYVDIDTETETGAYRLRHRT